MCLEESFCPFTRDALNCRPEIYAPPHHPAVFRCPLSLSRHHWVTWRSSLSFCSVTAHRKSRVRSNNALTRKVYVTLVYMFLFAVELLCCKISFTDLLSAMLCSHSLMIHVYLMFLYTESSFHYPLIYAIWWALLRDHISVWMDDRDAHTLAHTHWSTCDVSMRT